MQIRGLRRSIVVWFLFGLCGCVRVPRAGGPGEPAIDGDARLSDAAVPTRYRLELTVDPAHPEFSGEAWISVRLDQPTDVIRLHGKDLDVRHVEVLLGRSAPADQSIRGKAERGKNGGLALVFARDIPVGEHVIHMFYDGRFADGLTGLYRVKVGDDSYAFTQFEALHARKAFPCFDEPRFKTPWEITLRVPHGLVAASNAPVAGVDRQETFDLIRFEPTAPLPTYLVAFVVGPFDVVDAPAPADGIPLRVLTVRGKHALAGYALQRTPGILAALHDYFGRPYPYSKLDLVAVPDFGAGAMENAGLVTFREELLLVDAERAAATERYELEATVAHELAHQWFGNLVTMAWWDDLWLNEGFATWMEVKVLTTTAREFHADLDAVGATDAAMQADALTAARAVRQPIKDGGDVLNAFDSITYEKGAAILRMLEAWAGEEHFRAGIRAYLNAHAWGSARTQDFFAALEQATGLPIADVATTFLDQPGTPLFAVSTVCEHGIGTARLTQSRYLPEGTRAPSEVSWHVPVCVRYGRGAVAHRQCALITEEHAALRLEGAECPAWIHPNADESGYYRWRLPEPQLLALVAAGRRRLTAPEEAALPSDLDALLVAAEIDGGTYLEALGQLAHSERRQVIEAVIAGWHRVHHATVDYDGSVPADAFAAYVRRALGARAHALGMLPKRREDSETALLRAQVMPTVADIGRDATVRARAHNLTRRFLANVRSVPSAAAQIAVAIAALDGDAALHDALVTALSHAEDPCTRSILLAGIGGFRDPALFQRSLDLYFTDALRVNDFWSVMGHARDTQALQGVAFAWLADNFDRVVAKLGDDGASSLPFVGGGFCDAAGRERVQQLFAVPAHQRPGSARPLAQTLEGIDQCIRLRVRATPSVAAFLGVSGS